MFFSEPFPFGLLASSSNRALFSSVACLFTIFFKLTLAYQYQKAVKKAKEDWIGAQCEEIETCLNKNNSKRAYQLVKDLTSEKQCRS